MTNQSREQGREHKVHQHRPGMTYAINTDSDLEVVGLSEVEPLLARGWTVLVWGDPRIPAMCAMLAPGTLVKWPRGTKLYWNPREDVNDE